MQIAGDPKYQTLVGGCLVPTASKCLGDLPPSQGQPFETYMQIL